VDQAEYDEMLRRLMVLTVSMGTAIERLEATAERHEGMLEELRDFNRQQVAINQRLETLLQRLVNPSGNGHEGPTR
jgi:hypothetical protein